MYDEYGFSEQFLHNYNWKLVQLHLDSNGQRCLLCGSVVSFEADDIYCRRCEERSTV